MVRVNYREDWREVGLGGIIFRLVFEGVGVLDGEGGVNCREWGWVYFGKVFVG